MGREAADDETATEIAEKAGHCDGCETEITPDDVHIERDNALWEFYPVADCPNCNRRFEPGFGWHN